MCAIHTYLKMTSQETYTPAVITDFEDIYAGVIIPESWIRKVINLPTIDRTRNLANHSSRQAREQRDKYADYFAGSAHYHRKTNDVQIRILNFFNISLL